MKTNSLGKKLRHEVIRQIREVGCYMDIEKTNKVVRLQYGFEVEDAERKVSEWEKIEKGNDKLS